MLDLATGHWQENWWNQNNVCGLSNSIMPMWKLYYGQWDVNITEAERRVTGTICKFSQPSINLELFKN